MSAARSAAFLLLAVGVPLLAGCQPGDFRAETELHPDGSVTRTVQQKELAGDVEAWDERESVAFPRASDWDRPLADEPLFPKARRGRGENGYRASGRFASAADLPDAVELPITSYSEVRETADVPPSRLERDVTVTDLGVLTLYEWEETLTAGTDPVRMERTRRSAVKQAAPLVVAVLEDELGEGTDAAPLGEWILITGDAWTADLLAVLFEEAARPGPLLEAPADRIREVGRHYGLDAPDPREDPEGAKAAARAFSRALLAEHVSFKGRPLAGEKLDRAMAVLGLEQSSAPLNLTLIWNRQLADKYGSQDKGHDEANRALARFFGPNGMLTSGESFAYRHRTPGMLLETNGSILSVGDDGEPAEVLFRFDIRDAWPFGRPMTARSAVLHPERQREWFGEVLVADRVEVLQFLERLKYSHVREKWLAAVEAGDAETLRDLLK